MSSFVRRKLEKFTSGVEWDRTPSIPSLIVPLSPAPKNSQFGIRRNETLEMDSMRLQGLMRNDMVRDSLQLEEKMIERIRWKSWMVNEGL